MTLFQRMAFRNLAKNRRRSVATGLAVTAGFTGLCLLGGYLLRTERILKVASVYINHSGHLSIYRKGGLDYFYSNPKKYLVSAQDLQAVRENLAKNPDVEFVVPVLQGTGLISNGNKSVPFLGYGLMPDDEARIINHDQVQVWAPELAPAKGELSIKDARGDLKDTISITKELGSLIGKKPPFMKLSKSEKDVQLAGKSVLGDLNAVNATLGFRHTTGFSMLEDTGLVAPLPLLQDLYSTDGSTFLAVYLKPEVFVSGALTKVQEQISKINPDLEVYPMDDERVNLFYVGTMGFLYIMAGFFIFLIFSAVALSIVNSMTLGVLERVREIGTLKAIGFNNSQTAWLFTLESAFLSAISIIFGYIATQAIALVVNSLNIRFTPPGVAGDMQFVLTPDTWFCLSMSIPVFLICVACSYLVSKKLVNRPIANLLAQAN